MLVFGCVCRRLLTNSPCVAPTPTHPTPRAGARNTNDRRYVHGGRDAGAHDKGFMDLWNLNFGHVTTLHVRNNHSESVDLAILDGRNLFSKIEIANGFRASSEFAQELEQCIVDLNVNVEIRHACLRDVSVWLINKGPKLQGA